MIREKEVNKTSVGELLCEVKQRLLFPHGVLTLLKSTDLFGVDIERAIDDVDYLMNKAKENEECRSL